MAKIFYYAVKNGRTPGIYYSWEDCKIQVIGYKNAIYKKFSSEEQAINFIESTTNDNKRNIPLDSLENIGDFEAITYVDGSYNSTTKECGFGVVFFSSKGKEEFSKKVEISKFSEYRNVTGEIFGCIFAIKKAIEYGFKKIYIHYDYTGISNWALGYWKTNNELTQFYKTEFLKLNKKIEVEFIKVEAHTGDKYNEEADILAKKSVGVA